MRSTTRLSLLLGALVMSAAIIGCGGVNVRSKDKTTDKTNQSKKGWPDEVIKLYGPGTNSGTFDYFTEEICGKEDRSRTDYTSSEEDEVIIKGVSENKYALGYVGLAYYVGAKEKLKAVAIKDIDGDEYVLPTPENVNSDKYSPLSRPLFIYVKKEALKRPEVRAFVQFYLGNPDLVKEAKYVNIPDRLRLKQIKTLEETLKAMKLDGKDAAELSGKIAVDGSSTVAPITKKVAEVFKKKHGNVNISIGISGTGGGFKKFYNGETDISDASRPIKASEIKMCKEKGIEFIELKVGLDGLAVIINSENDWAEQLTVQQLEQIWRPDNPAKKWSDVKAPN